MDPRKLRAWWFHRQGLDGSLAGQSAAAVLEATGWARSVGGAVPYLGLRARCGAGREEVDHAVAIRAIQELPSVRGCTYIVPEADYALALQLGQPFGPEADMKLARKLGVTDAEVDRLCAAVLAALASGPLTPEELRAATGGASRSLGDPGKKKGLSTTLPLALGRLQAAGEIHRIPTNGRLDQQRYRYALWQPNPLATARASNDECQVKLARRFFRWIGPATVHEFQGFSALGVTKAKAAMEALDLVALEDELWLLPEDVEAFKAFRAPTKPRYTLLGNLDAMVLLRRGLGSLLADDDLARQAAGVDGIVEIGHISDLMNHVILDRGQIIGLWEYDPDAAEIVWTTFGRPDTALRAEIAATESYIKQDLGDMRGFGLDSPKSRVPRLEQLRASSPG